MKRVKIMPDWEIKIYKKEKGATGDPPVKEELTGKELNMDHTGDMAFVMNWPEKTGYVGTIKKNTQGKYVIEMED